MGYGTIKADGILDSNGDTLNILEVTTDEVTTAAKGYASAADKTKLDGIEDSATADQTGAEIKTAYEAEANTNAYDDAAVAKLAGIAAGAEVNVVTSVASKTGAVTLAKGDVGLGNVNNTADADKPVSTVTQTALDSKADLVGGVIPTSQIPAIAITAFLGSVGSEAAMLALTGQPGDWCLRTDKAVGYVIIGANPTLASNWEGFTVPGSAVTSTNSQTGDVVLGYADVGAASAAQGALAGSAVQPGDNVSDLVNDAGYITVAQVPWEDDGTDDSLYPKTATRDVKIGGTLPSAPNIKLNTNGNVDMGTNLTLNRSGHSSWNTTNGSGGLVFNQTVISGGDGVNRPKLYLSQASGHFARGFKWLKDDGSTLLGLTSGNILKFGGDLDTSPYTANISLNATDGSASFAGTINGLTVGLGAGNVASNTAVGNNALQANTTGGSNTAIGRDALSSNTQGINNTAVGRQALSSNTTGRFNIAVGYQALGSNTEGEFNTANGYAALYSNTEGNSNTAHGYLAGYYIEGSNNTVLGGYQGTAADATLSDTIILSAGTSEKLRIDSTGSLLFGGTLPSAPNITLNGADGSASLAGSVNASGSAETAVNFGGLLNATGPFGLYLKSSGGIYETGSAIRIDQANGTKTAEILADGSATFAGSVGIGGDLSIEDSSYIRVRQTGDNASTAVQLGPDGSGTFAGSVTASSATVTSSSDEKIVLQGSTSPYIRWRDGTTDKAYLQYDGNSGGIYLWNQNSNTGIVMSSSFNYHVGGNAYSIWHAGNDGAGSGLDADTLDGIESVNLMGRTGSYWNANTWLQFSAGHGLYWPNNSAYHVYLDGPYLRIQNSGTANGIKIYTDSSVSRGFLYANNNNEIGLLNGSGSWSLQCDSSGNVTATGNVTAYSDIRIKENVRTVDNALDKVKSMRGVYFDRKDNGKASVGVIAQEIEEILPEVVQTQDTRTEHNPDALPDLKTVSYGNIVGVLIEAIKDQQKQIDELKAQLENN